MSRETMVADDCCWAADPESGYHCWHRPGHTGPHASISGEHRWLDAPPPDGIHPRRCECGAFREAGTVCPRCGREVGNEEEGGDRRDDHAAVERDRLTTKGEGER